MSDDSYNAFMEGVRSRNRVKLDSLFGLAPSFKTTIGDNNEVIPKENEPTEEELVEAQSDLKYKYDFMGPCQAGHCDGTLIKSSEFMCDHCYKVRTENEELKKNWDLPKDAEDLDQIISEPTQPYALAYDPEPEEPETEVKPEPLDIGSYLDCSFDLEFPEVLKGVIDILNQLGAHNLNLEVHNNGMSFLSGDPSFQAKVEVPNTLFVGWESKPAVFGLDFEQIRNFFLSITKYPELILRDEFGDPKVTKVGNVRTKKVYPRGQKIQIRTSYYTGRDVIIDYRFNQTLMIPCFEDDWNKVIRSQIVAKQRFIGGKNINYSMFFLEKPCVFEEIETDDTVSSFLTSDLEEIKGLMLVAKDLPIKPMVPTHLTTETQGLRVLVGDPDKTHSDSLWITNGGELLPDRTVVYDSKQIKPLFKPISNLKGCKQLESLMLKFGDKSMTVRYTFNNGLLLIITLKNDLWEEPEEPEPELGDECESDEEEVE